MKYYRKINNPALTHFMRAQKRKAQIRDLKQFLRQLDEFMSYHNIMCVTDFENEHYSEFLDMIQQDQQTIPDWIDVPFKNVSEEETENPPIEEFLEDGEQPPF